MNALEAIFASKLFQCKSQEEQEKVKATLADPVNMELVQQLRSYLDEEYQTEELLSDNEEEDATEEEAAEQGEGESEEGENDDNSSDKSSDSSIGKLSDKLGDFSDLPDESAPPVVEEETIGKSWQPEEKEVAEAVKVDGELITASDEPECVSVDNLKPGPADNELSKLKDELNIVADTAGVMRIRKKGDELWVYYGDNVNLNSIMDSVIDRLYSLNYMKLEFNRLARSDNAVVFQVAEASSDNITNTTEETT